MLPHVPINPPQEGMYSIRKTGKTKDLRRDVAPARPPNPPQAGMYSIGSTGKPCGFFRGRAGASLLIKYRFFRKGKICTKTRYANAYLQHKTYSKMVVFNLLAELI